MALPSDNKILEQIQNEYLQSYQTVVDKRETFRANDELLNNTKNRDKLDMKTLYYIRDGLLSLYYNDEVIVSFQPRKFWAEEQSQNLNSLAKFDYDEMDLAIHQYDVQNNRLMRWVGIMAQVDWDEVTMTPRWKSIDTRWWIPDVSGWFDPKDFRYHGFEVTRSIDSLVAETGLARKKLEGLRNVTSSEQEQTRQRAQQARELNPQTNQETLDNRNLDVYFHYTIIDKSKYLCMTDNARTMLLKRPTKIEPVLEEEKADESKVMFPVSLFYFRPERHTPYGVSLPDLMQDKHRYKNVLANLMFLKEKDAALGDDIIYDTNIIKNRNDLSKSTLNKKFIWADGRQGNIQNAVAVIPKNPAGASTYNFSAFLDRDIQMAVGIDPLQLGVQSWADITATEAQQLQANNNLKSIFNNKINKVWEKTFWKLWYKSYKEHFDEAKKKIIRVTNAFGTQNIEFTKDDFIGQSDPDIQIELRSEVVAQNNKDRASLTPLLLSVLNNPNKPQAAKDYAERKLYTMSGASAEEALVYAPRSFEEQDALQKLVLINNNDPAGIEIDNMEVDHNTYITIFEGALDNPAKFAAIEARKQAIILTGQNKQQIAWDQQVQNIATNQLVAWSQRANEQEQWVITRQDASQSL